MLAEIKMLVPKSKVINQDTVITHARAAEKSIHDRDHYKAPPPPEVCLMPQVAYKQESDALRQTVTPKGAPAVAEVTEIFVAAAYFATACKEALAQLNVPGNATGGSKRNDKKNQLKSTSSITIEGVPGERKPQREPTSNYNAGQASHGPAKSPIKCYGCGWPGYYKRSCPACSLKMGKDGVSAFPEDTQGTSNPSLGQTGGNEVMPLKGDSPSDIDCMGIGGFRLRALCDSGAARAAIDPIGIQIASACGRSIIPYKGTGAKLANGQLVPIYGHVELPFDLLGQRRYLSHDYESVGIRMYPRH
ncbi:hypothetical protein TSAR_013086 [Trichomalopsis sarcophagae]|uniref:CCHC-type domain-containing protein n=1 Tax=Trichomalopsis sarcophagae TaxID=543379 RepID=A0A232FMM2_9HYME|nr:hypothetical protein TSAR_013086 [Trichomalopsis sarcophagae]